MATSETTSTTTDTKAADLAELARQLVNAGEARAREEVAQRICSVMAQAKAEAQPPAPEPRLLGFPATMGVYSMSPRASSDDVYNHLSARLSQLSAMLAMTFGGGYEAFKSNSDCTQENYLWACSMLADECEELADVLEGIHSRERDAEAAA